MLKGWLMKLKRFCAALLAGAIFLTCPAEAKLEEVRIGAVANIRNDHGRVIAGKHEGVNLEYEIVSDSPDLLNFIGSPRPYALISVAAHDDGVTFGGIGVYWRWEFADGWAFEPGFGYIVHDGAIDNNFPDGTPAAAAFEADNQLLGSNDLFRASFALEREFTPRLAAQLYWEHMSHGEVLDRGRNQGLDYVGVRLLYRFGEDFAD